VAPQKLAQAAWVLGLGGKTEEVARKRLFARVDALLAEVGMPRSAAAAGIDPDAYRAAIPDLVRDAFRDASVRTNPRMPMLDELASLLSTACDPEPAS
jgi:acetaldehyde dehydrogenase/alcohol dehydrogenase